MVSLMDGIFWGALLIIVGVWFLVRHLVPVRIPVIRIIIAVFLVYLGIRVLVHGPSFNRDVGGNTMVFSESTLPYTPGEGRDYNVIFSRGTVDLASVTVSGTTVHARVNVIFGNGTLRINPQAPVRVRMTSAFGSVDSPNGTSVAFGDTVYTSPSYRDGAPALDVNATAVFGRLAIVP